MQILLFLPTADDPSKIDAFSDSVTKQQLMGRVQLRQGFSAFGRQAFLPQKQANEISPYPFVENRRECRQTKPGKQPQDDISHNGNARAVHIQMLVDRFLIEIGLQKVDPQLLPERQIFFGGAQRRENPMTHTTSEKGNFVGRHRAPRTHA